MAEFSQIDDQQNIPFTGTTVSENALELTNPDSVLTGTNRGQQALGAPNIKTDSANQRIVVNDNTTNRVTFGRIGTGVNDWGLKVSKPTFNVDTATAAQLIFNSSQNTFKIVVSSSAAQPVASLAQDATTTVTVAHNLGYIPAAIVYLNGTGSTYLTANRYYTPPVVVPIKVGATYYPGIIHTFSIDSTNIYFMITNSSAATPITDIGTVNWKYYLLQETAS